MPTVNDLSPFQSAAWTRALSKYSAATHLTVEIVGLDGERLMKPVSPTPVYDALGGSGRDVGLFAACALGCLGRADRDAAIIEERNGLAVVGVPLVLDGVIVGAAVAKPGSCRRRRRGHPARASIGKLDRARGTSRGAVATRRI